MNIEEAYRVLQAEWVRLYNIEVGDIVKVLRPMKTDELGCDGMPCGKLSQERMVGEIRENCIHLNFAGKWPFFCLEFVKKAEPKIEITVKVSGKESKLSDISEETLLRIRNNS